MLSSITLYISMLIFNSLHPPVLLTLLSVMLYSQKDEQ